ncbi:hypothetical protein Tco_0592128, partial [Tanacetum coccineum]
RVVGVSPSFGFSLSTVALSTGAELGGIGYGGLRMVVPDLVMIVRVGVVGSSIGVLLFPKVVII